MSDQIDIADRYSLGVLEYPAIIKKLAGSTQSKLGYSIAEKLLPLSDSREISRRLDITDDARHFFDRERAIPTFQGLNDVFDSVGRAQKGGQLNPHELHLVNVTIKSMRGVRRVIRDAQFEYPVLKNYAQQIGLFPEIEDIIDNAIHPEGYVLDRASSELKRIRREISTERERAESTIAGMIQRYSKNNYLREQNFTVRNGRYVLPFRQDCQKNVKAVVQSRSPSGATVFLEPYELVERNNRLTELKSEEESEIIRILIELSAMVGSRGSEISSSLNTSAFLDFAFACGRLSFDWKASRARSGNKIQIKDSRHPIIPSGGVVPVDIEFPGEAKGLIITGPNAGGKTVALKTLGLFALINQAGLHIPARDPSMLPVFGSVHADIGDFQSIEWSLSSFSAHVVFLKRMFKSLEDNRHTPGLILLDEIGRSTDPQEGSALALAVIEKLLELDCFIAVTTHLPAIKNLVLEDDGRVAGASVQFDLEKGEPLYKIKIGTLGASYAVNIAKKLGLNSDVLKRANKLLESQGDLLSVDIPGLENQLEKLKQEVSDAEINQQKASKSLAGLIALEKFILDNALANAEKIAASAEKKLEEAKKLASRLPHESDRTEITDKLKQLREYRDRVKSAVDSIAVPPEAVSVSGDAVAELNLVSGDKVWVLNIRREAVLEELSEKRATVSVGGKRLKVKLDQIKPLEKEEDEVKKAKVKVPPQ
ncbi:MAG TPA: MutS2/Smr-associated SH3 domain-containing protein, partial [bacterium]